VSNQSIHSFMKLKFLGLAFGAVLFACGCASPSVKPDKMVDGSTGYISSAEVLKHGENSFGIPATSFAFYYEGFKPAPPYPEFKSSCPSNMAIWDRSCTDAPGVTHDAFLPERLFVVKWGSGKDEVGVPAGGWTKPEYMGLHAVPNLVFLKNKRIEVGDLANNKTIIYNWDGSVAESFDTYMPSVLKAQKLEDTFISDEEKKDVVCKLDSAKCMTINKTLKGQYFWYGANSHYGGIIECFDPKKGEKTSSIYLPSNDEYVFYEGIDKDFSLVVLDKALLQKPFEQVSMLEGIEGVVAEDSSILHAFFVNGDLNIYRWVEK